MHGGPASAGPLVLTFTCEDAMKKLALMEFDPRNDCAAYDTLAEETHRIVVDSPGWLPKAAAAIGYPRPCGPRRTPSPRCESGKRPYCTCDTCF